MAELIVGERTVWKNPDELGHFGIKLRKQIREDEIVDRMVMRRARSKIVTLLRSRAKGSPQ